VRKIVVRNWPMDLLSRSIIEVMTSPFRYNKKQRKKLRRSAKNTIKAASKFEAEGANPEGATTLRWLACLDTRMSLAKRRAKEAKK
jgi:hypothetical protein